MSPTPEWLTLEQSCALCTMLMECSADACRLRRAPRALTDVWSTHAVKVGQWIGSVVVVLAQAVGMSRYACELMMM